MGFLRKLLKSVDGWKTTIAYILLNIPYVGAYPMLKGALQDVIANPGSEAAWANLVAQVLLAGGVFHRVVKNFKL